VVRVPNEEAAIAMANDSQFGLGASVFSTELDRARRVAERIDAGMVFINTIVVSEVTEGPVAAAAVQAGAAPVT
jgi:succinate-semialdehyde dehydrogenase / glutarate-semialdehyde dehydrogenase